MSLRHFAVRVAIAVLTISGHRFAGAADESVSPSRDRAGLVAQGRGLLRSGRVADADRLLRTLDLESDDALACLAGEVRFRQGEFEAARRAFRAAADRNPKNARAWWGLGRIEQIHFRAMVARDLFAKAFHLDWRDTDIILSYLEFVSDPAPRERLLRNVAALAVTSMPERAERAVAQIRIEAYLAGRTPAALATDYTSYRIPLGGFHPSGANPRGVTLAVRINGGKPLHLVLDTGARGILLHKSAARGLQLETVVAGRVGGFGDESAADSTLMLARDVAFDVARDGARGDLRFRDCLIQVTGREIAASADGVIGPSLFERFRVRIDARSHAMELTPGDAEVPGAPGALGLDRLLLLRTSVSGGREGWFLVDTGSAFTTVGPGLGPMTRLGELDLAGAQGGAGAFRVAPVALRVGGRSVTEPEPILLDLAAVSQREGVEISGILGYATLSRWPVTIDFRTGLVKLGD